jgi:hypothetical protein
MVHEIMLWLTYQDRDQTFRTKSLGNGICELTFTQYREQASNLQFRGQASWCIHPKKLARLYSKL